MQYVYAALLLHKAGKEITEENVKKVLEAAGVKPEDARVKALISALEGVDIEKAIKEATVTQPVVPEKKEEKPEKVEKREEKKKEEKVSEEAAAAGLGALFG